MENDKDAAPPLQRQLSSATASPQSSGWTIVDECQFQPCPLISIDDLVGLVMEFCDGATLLRLRLVCRRWGLSTASSSSIIPWRWVFARLKEIGTSSNELVYTLVSKALTGQADQEFDVVDECWVASLTADYDDGNDTLETTTGSKFTDCVICVFETERYFPTAGFRKRRLVGDPPLWFVAATHHATVLSSSTNIHANSDNQASSTSVPRMLPLPNGLLDVNLADGFDWCTDWSVVLTLPEATESDTNMIFGSAGGGGGGVVEGFEPTDGNGWRYSFSWMSGCFGEKWKPFVRKREWRRLVRKVEKETSNQNIANDEEEEIRD